MDNPSSATTQQPRSMAGVFMSVELAEEDDPLGHMRLDSDPSLTDYSGSSRGEESSPEDDDEDSDEDSSELEHGLLRERGEGRGIGLDRLEGDEEEEDGIDGEDEEAAPGFPRHVQRALWRVILGDPARMAPESSTHDELIESLRRTRRLIDPKVDKAMSLIPRGTFIPTEYQNDAYLDCPLAVEHLHFNISAPHIHATCLESLKFEEGQSFLDVGSGCGLVSCFGAYLVGKGGSVTGIEINQQALALSKENLTHLEEQVPEYTMQACKVRFEERNVFLPDPLGRTYDRINVAGTCPMERIGVLLDLLNEGGKLIVPSGRNGSELQLYTKESGGSGKVSKDVVLHVRFGDLKVPLDSEVVVETLELNRIQEREELMRKHSANSASASASSSSGMSEEDMREGGGDDEGMESVLGEGEEYDCMLVGKHMSQGVPAKKELLASKCMLFKAQFSSGMKDAGSDHFVIPEHFSRRACELFVDFLQGKSQDWPQDFRGTRLELQALVVELLQLGTYVSCPSLCKHCEVYLEREICSDNCVNLLMVADETGCTPLLHYSCLSYIVKHYEAIKAESNNFEGLEPHLVKQIAERAATMLSQVMKLLEKQTEQAKASLAGGQGDSGDGTP